MKTILTVLAVELVLVHAADHTVRDRSLDSLRVPPAPHTAPVGAPVVAAPAPAGR